MKLGIFLGTTLCTAGMLHCDRNLVLMSMAKLKILCCNDFQIAHCVSEDLLAMNHSVPPVPW